MIPIGCACWPRAWTVKLGAVEEEFTSLLRSWNVLGYHGCRPQDLTPYFTNGIKALDPSELMQSSTMPLSRRISQTWEK